MTYLMDETTFFNWFMIIAIVLLAFYVIITLVNKKQLNDIGVETDGYILDSQPVNLNRDYTSELQSISVPTIKFTTRDGKEITGQPITGVYTTTNNTGLLIRILYNPDNPEEFMIKE